MNTTFTIPGEPQGKARAKVVYRKNLGHTVAITPDKTVMYENLVKTCYMDQGGQFHNEQPIFMVITAVYSIPKSTSKKKAKMMEKGYVYPTKKPDADNVAKIVADSLNGVAYKDDSQIIKLQVNKRYGDEPRLIVSIVPYGRDLI